MTEENNFGFIALNGSPPSSSSQEASSDFGFKPLPPQTIQEGLKQVPLGLGRVAAKTAATGLAAPSKALGGLFQFLGNLYPGSEKESSPLPTIFQNIGKFLSETGKEGEKFLKSKIEEGLGTSYSSVEDALTGFGERAARIYGGLPLRGMAIPALSGGAAGETAQQLGAPEETQEAAEILGMGAPGIAKGIEALSQGPIKEKSGLVLPRIVEKTKEGLKIFKPKTFAGRKEKTFQNVAKQAEDLIKEIQKESLPLSEEIAQGIDVEGRVLNQLDQVEDIASKMTQKIESNVISDYLEKSRQEIQKAPVPSQEKKEILKLIDDYEKKFGTFNSGKRFYTPEEYVKQYRNIWEDAKSLFETKLLKGERGATRNFYGGLNNSIAETLEAGTPQSFSELFKNTNQEFSQLQKIDKFDQVLSKVTEDGIINPRKLSKYFKNPKDAKFLRKQIGNEGYDRLKLVSDDLTKVQDKLGLIEDMDLGQFIKSGVTYSILSKLGIPFAKPLQLLKKGADITYGNLLQNPKVFRDVQNFLKALRSGNKKMIQGSLTKLDNKAQELEVEE